MAFLTRGYQQSVEEVLHQALFDVDYDEMVIVKDIEFYSMCEHHLLPFFGKANVAYVPHGKVIGLSKIPRIVDVFARRLQSAVNGMTLATAGCQKGFDELLSVIGDFQYPMSSDANDGANRGIFITVTSALEVHEFGCIIAGADTADVVEIQRTLQARIAEFTREAAC